MPPRLAGLALLIRNRAAGAVKATVPDGDDRFPKVGKGSARRRKPANSFRYFNSPPKMICRVVVMYVRFCSGRHLIDRLTYKFRRTASVAARQALAG